jgi:hypothetical protein
MHHRRLPNLPPQCPPPQPGSLNPHPWYLGQPPFRATSRRSIDNGWLANAYVIPSAITPEELRSLMAATQPLAAPPETYPEKKTVDTLAMVGGLFDVCWRLQPVSSCVCCGPVSAHACAGIPKRIGAASLTAPAPVRRCHAAA